MRWVLALVTTSAPARAQACSMGPATALSSAEKANATSRGWSLGSTVSAASRGGMGIGSRHRAASPYARPALCSEAVTATISNQGWSARSRTNFWPTVPVAPRMATGYLGLMRPSA